MLGENILGDVRKILGCLGSLERLSFEIYDNLSVRIDEPKISWMLEYIALDSWKHYLLYSKILEQLKGKMEIKEASECRKLLGEGFVRLVERGEEILEKAREKKKLSLNDLSELLSLLNDIEVLAGEETYMRMVSTLLKESELAEKEPGIAVVFELIEEDEKEHESLLDKISELIGKKG